MADEADHREHIVCLGGGNALGAFYGGVVQAFSERDVVPVHISGTSIGAITAALWMGGAPDGAVGRLKQFWNAAADKAVWGAASIWRRNAVVRALLYGRPALFHASFPGMLAAMPGVPPDDHVFDTAPMRRLLLGLIDFDALNASACRITISAMDQTTAEVLRFDNRTGHLTVDHVLASASIPVAFPPVMLEGRPLIDAGLGDNCPALALLDRPIERPTCAWIADLWPAEAERAGSLDLILRRSQDIAFAAQRLRSVGELRKHLAERSGEPPPVTLTEIVHDGAGYEIGGKAFDFTQAALARRWAAGHEQTRRALDSVA